MKRVVTAALIASAFCVTGCGTLVRDGLARSYMGISIDG